MTTKFTVAWYDSEHAILLIQLQTIDWEWQDLADAIDKQVEMAKTVDYRVHAIFDFSSSSHFPTKGLITRLPHLMTTEAGNEDLILVIHRNPVFEKSIRFVARAFNLKLALSNFRFVASMHGALQEIEFHESMLRHEQNEME